MSARPLRVVVAGKMPPPYGGQTINIRRLYGLFSGIAGLEVLHWDLDFSRDVRHYRQIQADKIFHLFKVLFHLIRLRRSGPLDWIIFPTGGPHTSAMLRDLVLVPWACCLGQRVVVHFRAAGIARKLPTLPAFFQFLLRKSHSHCWGAISLTDFGKEDPAALGLETIVTVANGLEKRKEAAQNSSPNRDRLVLLGVGHLCADKGTPALLKAFARLSAGDGGHRLVLRLVGEVLPPFSQAELDAQIVQLGIARQVEIAGLKTGEELFDEYRRASLFVFPSVAPYESFGMVLIEAMQFGLPVVVSDWRANREVTAGCGGVLYDPTSDHPAALTSALQRALEQQSQWQEWGVINRRLYDSKYTLDILRSRWESFLLSPPTRPARPNVVIAGQMPPPIGGQTLNIERIYNLLTASGVCKVQHWDFQFSKDANSFRKIQIAKVVELFRVALRLLAIRCHGRPDWILYPSGGPHRTPILRDIALLPFTRLFSPRLVIHFQAAGIAEKIPRLPWWLRRLVCWAYGMCWGAVVLTEFGKRDALAAGITNIAVIPNAVEDDNPEALLPQHQAGPAVLLHVGHLCPAKGTVALLEAFALLSARSDDLILRLVGECISPYSTRELKQDLARLKISHQVEVLGELSGEALHAQYRSASLLAFPSVAIYESFGLVLAEAMMWGLPLVVADWRASSEVVGSPCGGVLYQPGEDHVSSLHKALRQALDSRKDWPTWSRMNRQRYEDHFTVDRFQDDWLKLFAPQFPE